MHFLKPSPKAATWCGADPGELRSSIGGLPHSETATSRWPLVTCQPCAMAARKHIRDTCPQALDLFPMPATLANTEARA